MLSDKKAAKKIIKVAKCCPNLYTNEEVSYAKIYKRSLKNARFTQSNSK
tara:strand:- start:317 stop:463 length:147 start_codon:yes stop_codon:yes gene_type:complete